MQIKFEGRSKLNLLRLVKARRAGNVERGVRLAPLSSGEINLANHLQGGLRVMIELPSELDSRLEDAARPRAGT